MRIALILPNWIGDVAMATPLLRALRNHWGEGATLLGVMRPYAAQVLSGLPWLDDCLLYDPRAGKRETGTRALVGQLRARRLDAIVLLTNSFRTGVIARLSGARRRVGYVRCWRGPLLTDRLYPPRSGRRLAPISPVDYYLELGSVWGCATDDRRLQLATTAADEQAADRVWSERGFSQAERVIAFNCGGAYGGAKHWPAGHFADLAARLASQPENRVLILCGPPERATVQEIVRLAAHPRVTSLASAVPSIGLSKACVRRSQLLVTTDSGPRHFAAAFDVPCVALFGPTDPRWSWNYHPGELVLQEPLPCAPCARRVCPLKHHRCMLDLRPDRVYHAVQQQLAAAERRQPET